jgi:hypothetical protein
MEVIVRNPLPTVVCRCGSHATIGHATIAIAGCSVAVEITAHGVRWPSGFSLPKEDAPEVETQILDGWLSGLRAVWAKRRDAQGAPR